jgi:uridine kinase
MKGKLSRDYKQHIEDIESFIYDYNYNRFPAELYSFSPMEVIDGKIPDKNRYKHEIEEAKKNRLKANQNYTMCYGKMSFNTENKTFC